MSNETAEGTTLEQRVAAWLTSEGLDAGGAPLARATSLLAFVRAECDRTRQDNTSPCATCASPLTMVPGINRAWSTFGPCSDGKYHDTTCPVARSAMKDARWPCGKLRYPELST